MTEATRNMLRKQYDECVRQKAERAQRYLEDRRADNDRICNIINDLTKLLEEEEA